MLVLADARRLPLVDGCVQCVVTSPPYFGLRDYGTGTWVGGDAACPHLGRVKPRRDTNGNGEFLETRGSQSAKAFTDPVRGRCVCGAERVDRQIGLEDTPAAYVGQLVAVFREVWRVLAEDGVVWLNLGDSYAGSRDAQSGSHAGKHAPNVSALSANQVKAAQIRESGTGSLARTPGLKAKDLIGIPWRVALALQSDGWYLRSDIIWHKPNPMPESVTDRPTKAHEYLFLLTKSERYFYDGEAIKEPSVDPESLTGRRSRNDDKFTQHAKNGMAQARHGFSKIKAGTVYATRNRRSVWTVATRPYSGAHFATMPEELVEPCILAGSRVGDIVCDPFHGSGTVGAVAERLWRRWVGCDINPAYHGLAKKRTAQRGLVLSEAR